MMQTASSTRPPSLLHAASEEDLACRVQDGCAASFDELARRFQPRLMFVLLRRMGNHADAEDIAQKTLLRAYEKISLYNPSRRFSPWLFTIALRLAAEHHRRAQLPTTPGEPAAAVVDPTPSAEQKAIAHEVAQDVWSLAEQVLKPDQWTALWLQYGEGQSVKEISQALGRTSVAVRVLLFRARKSLAPYLAKYMEAADNETGESAAVGAVELARVQS